MTTLVSPAPRSRSNTTPFVLLVVVGALEVLLFVTGLAIGADGQDIPVLLLALITILLGAGPILFNVTQPPERRRILITLITLVYVISLVVPVFTQYFLVKGQNLPGSFRLSNYDPGDIARAQVVALLGLGMLLLGFYLPLGRAAASIFPKATREWPPRAALFLGLATVGFGWMIFIPGQLGLIPPFAGSGAVGTLASGSYFGISLLTLAWLQHRRREALLLLAIMIPLSMLFNFFTGSKRMFFTPPFMFALAYVVHERRIRFSWVAAAFAVLIVLYPVSEYYRQVVQTDNQRSIRHFVENPGAVLDTLSGFGRNVDFGSHVTAGLEATGRRLDALGVLTGIVKDTPARVPYQGGWTIGYIALSYVPRVIWHDKPGMTIGEWVSQTYGSPYDLHTDVGPTWMGELFFNWGYPGVILGMFVVGLLCRVLQERLFAWNATIPALFGAVVVLYAVSRSVQSGLMGPVNGTVYNLVPILFAHVLVGFVTGYQRSAAGRSPPPAPADLLPASPAH